MNILDTAALRRLLAKATPGEWRVDADPRIDGADQIIDCNRGFTICFMATSSSEQPDDAEHIVAIHNAATALLDAADRWAQVVALGPQLMAIDHQLTYGSPQKVTLRSLLALIGDGHE